MIAAKPLHNGMSLVHQVVLFSEITGPQPLSLESYSTLMLSPFLSAIKWPRLPEPRMTENRAVSAAANPRHTERLQLRDTRAVA